MARIPCGLFFMFLRNTAYRAVDTITVARIGQLLVLQSRAVRTNVIASREQVCQPIFNQKEILTMRSLRLKKSLLQTCIVASIMACSTPNVLASQIFDFDFSSTSVTGSGTLIGDVNGDGTFTVTSGGGSERLNGLDTTFSLIFNPNGRNRSPSPLNNFNFDNQLLLGQAIVVDNDGLLFSTATGIEQNFFDDNGQLRNALSSSPVGFTDEPLALQVTARVIMGKVPEPSGLLLGGLAYLGFVGWRRRQADTTLNGVANGQSPA